MFIIYLGVIVPVIHSSGIPSLSHIASFSTSVIHIDPSSPSTFATSIGKQSGPHVLLILSSYYFLNNVMTSSCRAEEQLMPYLQRGR